MGFAWVDVLAPGQNQRDTMKQSHTSAPSVLSLLSQQRVRAGPSCQQGAQHMAPPIAAHRVPAAPRGHLQLRHQQSQAQHLLQRSDILETDTLKRGRGLFCRLSAVLLL